MLRCDIINITSHLCFHSCKKSFISKQQWGHFSTLACSRTVIILYQKCIKIRGIQWTCTYKLHCGLPTLFWQQIYYDGAQVSASCSHVYMDCLHKSEVMKSFTGKCWHGLFDAGRVKLNQKKRETSGWIEHSHQLIVLSSSLANFSQCKTIFWRLSCLEKFVTSSHDTVRSWRACQMLASSTSTGKEYWTSRLNWEMSLVVS